MFEAVLLKNNDCLLYPNYSLFTLQEVQKTGNGATLLRLVCHFFQTCMLNGSWRLRQHSSVLLAWGAEYLTTRDSQSLPLSKAQFPADYRSDSLDCLRRSKLCSGYWSQAFNYWRVISKLRHPWTASSASLSFQLDKAVYIFGRLKVNMDLVQYSETHIKTPRIWLQMTTLPGSTCPTLWKEQYMYLDVPQESKQWKSVETERTVFLALYV